MGDTEEPGESESSPVRSALLQLVLVKLMKTACEAGISEGSAVSYADVVGHVGAELVKAEAELSRNPASELVMGEVMALRRVAAHFAEAPGHFEEKAETYFESLHESLDRMGMAARFVRGAQRGKK